jgi:CheY-like chemotaxis protein
MKKIKVLIVDDIFTNRLLLSEILSDIGYEYLEAENGKQAINIIISQEVDLVFMDIEMPVMNGLETIKYIRDKIPFPKNKITIVALTAHNPYTFFEDYNDAGFDGLLTKPYSIERIKATIECLSDLKGKFDTI